MKKVTFVLYFLTLSLASQEPSLINFMIDSNKSYVSYEGKHILHDWIGVNKNIKGVIVTENGVPNKIAVSVSVKDFDSGNSGRDSHALELIESLIHPKITFFSDEINQIDETINLLGKINFHGIEKQISVKGKLNKDKFILFKGDFVLSPSDFNVKLPSFMFSKMEDNIKIKYELFFEKK